MSTKVSSECSHPSPVLMSLGIGGKGADFFKSSWNVFFIKSCSGLVLYGFLLFYELLLDGRN
ncbi:hypothetical protein, partial [Peribacillus frigoritolerans]|uniref:hypothetical protein n=1 Tax=Peribacillus frigoritolerans TaxID=450367 RepID=UPI0020BF3A84